MNPNILIVVLAIIAFGALAFLYSTRTMRKACRFILDDLERQKAVAPDSAIELPYCRKQMLSFGLRDYRPDALNSLLKHDYIRVNEEGKFYLGKPLDLDGTGAKCPPEP